MHPLTSEVLSRFHRALVEEIGTKRPEYLTQAFTVAEIYQNLVPYGSHRDRIGVEMNGDYEDALLRLLAGEGDYVVLESEHARRELQSELERSNPNTGLFREFAAAEVRLNRARLPSSLVRSEDAPAPSPPRDLFGEPPNTEEGDEPVPVEDLAPTPAFATPPAPSPPASSTPTPRAMDATAQPDVCRWCRETLPARDTLNYCPFCGANATLLPCPNCGEELETAWRFCVACGAEATGSA